MTRCHSVLPSGMRSVLRIVANRRLARAAPLGVTVRVVRSRRDADRLLGQLPDRVQLATGGWGADRGTLRYLLDRVLTPMLVEGARLELVP